MNMILLLYFTLITLAVFLTGVMVGKYILRWRLRREGNKRLELEMKLLDKRAELLYNTRQLLKELDDIVYQTRVAKQIKDLTEGRDGSV